MSLDKKHLGTISKANSKTREISMFLDHLIKEKVGIVFSFNPDSVSRRIRQVMLSEFLPVLMKKVIKEENEIEKVCLRLSSNSVELKKSEEFNLKVSFSFSIKRLVRMLITMTGICLYVVRYYFDSKVKKHNITLALNPSLAEFIPEDKVVERYHEYCFHGRYSFLKKSDLVICWHKTPGKSNDDRLILSDQNIYIESLKFVDYSLLRVLKLIIITKWYFLKMILLSLLKPQSIFLSQDIAFLPLIELLNETKCIKNILLNTTFMNNQEIWLHDLNNRSFDVQMIWYGMSLKDLEFKNVPPVESPLLDLIHLENNYLWNSFHEDEMKDTIGYYGKIQVTNSNLWYEPHLTKQNRKNKKVILFFNNPKTLEHIAKTSAPEVYYYGAYEVQEKAFLDVYNSVNQAGQNIELVIKVKRSYAYDLFDPRISTLLKEMENKGCRIYDKEEEGSLDIYNEIYNSDLVICTPMSTPNFLASELGVPAVYYDPINVIQPKDLIKNGIEWASDPKTLELICNKILSKNLEVNH